MPTYRNDGSEILVTHGVSFSPGKDQTIGWYITHPDLILVSDWPPAVAGKDDLDATTITDPAINAAVAASIIDNYGGVIITLTAGGNAQTLQDPTSTAVFKSFVVVTDDGNGAYTIPVNGITMSAGEAQKFIWDGSAWVGVAAVDADDIAATPHGDIVAVNVQGYLNELEDEKMKRIASVDNEIARFDSTGGDVQGYTSKAPTISDDGEVEMPGGLESPLVVLVKEGNISAVVKGQPLAVTGAIGEMFKVALASCSDITKIRFLGIALDDTAQNNPGKVCFRGLVKGVDTTLGSAVNPNSEVWGAGDLLYVDTTAGNLTNVCPASGRCIKAGRTRRGNHDSDDLFVLGWENPIRIGAASGEDIILRMGDSAGTNKVSYRDYLNNEVASMDSDGLRSYADYKTIYIDAAEFVPCTTNGALQGSYEEPTNDIDLDIFLFEGGATPQRIICKKKLDENWDRGVIIGAKVDWNSESGSTAGDTVEWRIKMGAIGDGDAIDAALGTRQVISDTLLADNGTDWQTSPKTPNVTVAGSPAVGDAILIEIDRNGPGADTMVEKARFQGVTLQIKLAGAVSLWT